MTITIAGVLTMARTGPAGNTVTIAFAASISITSAITMLLLPVLLLLLVLPQLY